ncbi:unnamed protein product [Mytilus coruscus]|uniref:Reverse transcriptase domain-containing protein n=1 Tax=Mytilus coruscus TaxID=42192 RepID=A0A6J8CXD6_MYTCO|nr:unnamed protein product [Mytilus coruscus]
MFGQGTPTQGLQSSQPDPRHRHQWHPQFLQLGPQTGLVPSFTQPHFGTDISSGVIYASPQSSTSACTKTVSSFTQHPDNNVPVQAEQNSDEVLHKLQDEVNRGRMLGPFKVKIISTLRINPKGLVPKSDSSWRLITNLSFPPGESVNSYIDQVYCKVNYTSVDTILEKNYQCGSSSELARIDVKAAFRNLILNPADFDLLGIEFNDHFYIDKSLPFGCSISCKLFEKFATFLQWLVEERSRLHLVDHYLDEFIFISARLTGHCSILMEAFGKVCNELGVPIAENKTIGPGTIIPFLGFVIDTVRMMVIILQEKLEKLQSELSS